MMTQTTKEAQTGVGMPTLHIPDVESAIGLPFKEWAFRCHEVSLKIVKSCLLEGPRRVARGLCDGVGGQHSWVVIGDNCYDEEVGIIDPTLWSYDDTVEGIWYGTIGDGRHKPHGMGLFWGGDIPTCQGGEPIELEGLSEFAHTFMQMMYPLDIAAWAMLATQAPVQGWPSKEVFEAMYKHPDLRPLIPIDKVRMVTDLNPDGLYLPEK